MTFRVSLSMTSRKDGALRDWRVQVDLPGEMVTRELIPVLKRIRDEAKEQLEDLEMPR